MSEEIVVPAASVSARMRMLWDAARVCFGLGLLGLLGLGWSLFAVPLYYLLPKRAGASLGRGMIHSGFRFYLRALAALGACRFDLDALDALRGQGAMVIAPNHPALIDAVLVLSRLPQLACIMKASILDNPALGAGARLAGYIRNDDPHRMIQRAVAELQAGRQLLLFPESTRSTRYPVGPMRGSAGLIAKQAKVPVQTVFIETDSAFLAKGWPIFRCPQLPISYRVRLGRRFAPPEDVHAFVGELEGYFKEALADACLPQPWPDGGDDG